MTKQITGETESVMLLARAIRDAFQKLSRIRRKKAWESLTSQKGEKEITLLINNPERPISKMALLRSEKDAKKS